MAPIQDTNPKKTPPLRVAIQSKTIRAVLGSKAIIPDNQVQQATLTSIRDKVLRMEGTEGVMEGMEEVMDSMEEVMEEVMDGIEKVMDGVLLLRNPEGLLAVQ